MEGIPPHKAAMSRNILIGVVVVSLSVAGASAVYLLVKNYSGTGAADPKASKSTHQELQAEFDALKKKYEELETDRNNVLTQTKGLLQEKTQWAETREQLEALQKTNKLFMEQKERLLSENQKLKNDLATLLENFDSLKEAYQELQAKHEASEKENAELRSLLTKQVQATPEYQVLDREAKRLREENAKLGETINLLDSRLKKALERIKKDQTREVSQVRQVREQKLSIDTLRAQIGSLTVGNRELNQLINEAPDKIRVMAAQNKQLLRETADMHYNMGVFFTDNKEYARAEKEYTRALEFDPESLKVHYNLGYLYAEDMKKQDKAAYHLEKYLQLAPDSKDSEAVRSYVLTLGVWNKGSKK